MRTNIKSLQFFLIIISMFFPNCVFAGTIKIQSAEIEHHKYYDKVFIKTSDYIVPKADYFNNRIVIDFEKAKAINFNNKPKKSPRINIIRSGQFTKDIARVVIEVKGNVQYELSSIYGKNGVYVEILGGEGNGQIKRIEELEEMPILKTSEAKELITHKKIGIKSISQEAITIKVLKPVKNNSKQKESKILKGKIIVVDPGHGGVDPGAFGLGGIKEKELTLQTSFYLASLLKKSGAKVFLTRNKDEKISLEEVVEFTNKIRADAFVSVHYNSLDRSMSGTETYYYTPKSVRLAELVHKRMLFNLKRQDKGVKQGMFYAIHHAQMPAIIVEPVYITDKEEGNLVKTKTFQKEVAKSILEGIKDYFIR